MKTKIFLAIMMMIIVAGCGNEKKQNTKIITGQDGKQYVVIDSTSQNIVVDSISQNVSPIIGYNKIIDFGNGVYYFGYFRQDFGTKLSSFIQLHTELRMIAFAPDDRLGHGYTSGYFVYFEQNIPCPCDTIAKNQ
jgi:hypothetical protein